MRTKILKWGSGMGLRIPESLARAVGLQAGSAVEVAVDGGRLIVSSLRHPVYRLEDLVVRITNANRHDEMPPRDASGRESW
jgi:antitoxin MazE